MDETQAWKTCKYAVAADGGGEMAYELKEHGFVESYFCEQPQIIQLQKFPRRYVSEPNGTRTEMALLHNCYIGSNLSPENVKRLEAIVDNALAGCKTCKQYQLK